MKESFIVLLLHFERIEAAWFRVFWIFSNVDKVEIRINTNWYNDKGVNKYSDVEYGQASCKKSKSVSA